jgi:hypothetical protein
MKLFKLNIFSLFGLFFLGMMNIAQAVATLYIGTCISDPPPAGLHQQVDWCYGSDNPSLLYAPFGIAPNATINGSRHIVTHAIVTTAINDRWTILLGLPVNGTNKFNAEFTLTRHNRNISDEPYSGECYLVKTVQNATSHKDCDTNIPHYQLIGE